jgi:hypothetical protein
VLTLYRASVVHTLSYPATGEWVLVDDRHVQRVGSGEPPEAHRVVDLPGSTIVPGFVDTHVHLTNTGLALANEDVAQARSASDLLAVARRRSQQQRGLVFVRGFDETRWDVPRLPSLEELDAVTAGPLVIDRADGHVSLANTAAIRAADVADLPGAERDEHGNLTGRLTREANDKVGRWCVAALSDEAVQELQLEAAALAASRGVTCVHEMSMSHEHGLRDLRVFLGHRAQLPLDSVPIVATTDIPQVIDLRLDAIGGDLPADGSIGARTAAVAAPYDDGAGEGVLYFTDEELFQFFHGGHLAGLQVGVHAIGDRAIEQVLTAWERVYHALDSRGKRHFRARRHRVEHFEMPHDDHVERAAMLGLAVSAQPAFDGVWGGAGGLYEIALGAARADAMNPIRSLLERGIEVGAGSDSPVTPLDPMLAVDALERHHRKEQRLTRYEAFRVATIGSARLAHQEDKKGSLEPGMHADLAAYDADPLAVDSVLGLRPILTVSLGREVHAA